MYFSGLIGKQWAMLFAAQGYTVVLYDVISEQVTQALSFIRAELSSLQEAGFLRGTLSVEEQSRLISGTASLSQCVQDAIHVQVSNC